MSRNSARGRAVSEFGTPGTLGAGGGTKTGVSQHHERPELPETIPFFVLRGLFGRETAHNTQDELPQARYYL